MPFDVLPRVARGDQAAVDECIARYGGLVFSLARRLLHDANEVEDVVQDVFLAIWEGAGTYDPSLASETTFVGVIARRRIIDRRRQQARRPLVASLENFDPASDERDRVAFDDNVAHVQSHWGVLRDEERDVLELAIYKGMTYSQIASHCHLPLGTVKTRARNGLTRLRERLKSESRQPEREDIS